MQLLQEYLLKHTEQRLEHKVLFYTGKHRISSLQIYI